VTLGSFCVLSSTFENGFGLVFHLDLLKVVGKKYNIFPTIVANPMVKSVKTSPRLTSWGV